MRARLTSEGFASRLLPRRRWVEIAVGLRLLCDDSEYGAILALDAGGLLLLVKNDLPFCGAERFFRKLARGYKRSCLLALPEPAFGPDKRRAVQELGSLCDFLGVTHYAASEPHIHAREDSRWADAGRVAWDDIALHWNAQAKPFSPMPRSRSPCRPRPPRLVSWRPRRNPCRKARARTTGPTGFRPRNGSGSIASSRARGFSAAASISWPSTSAAKPAASRSARAAGSARPSASAAWCSRRRANPWSRRSIRPLRRIARRQFRQARAGQSRGLSARRLPPQPIRREPAFPPGAGSARLDRMLRPFGAV